MARIVRFHKLGSPEVLQIDDIDVPPPSSGEVRIRVKALGLNRAEVMFRNGKYLENPLLPSKLGYEASGIIEDVGPHVKGLNKGDVVSTVPAFSQSKYGVYGELANVPAHAVVKHPPLLTFVEAAAIWMQYMTAYGALIDIAAIKKGDHVAITAASSSVGLAAIQLCNLVGATSIALTRTSEKRKALQDAGAHHVLATEEEDVSAKLKQLTKEQGVAVVFDPVGGKIVQAIAESMSYNGIYIIYGTLSYEPTVFPLLTALSKGLTMRGYTLFEVVQDSKKYEDGKKFIIDAINSGKLKPIIAKTFDLNDIVEAHRFMESNKQFGKIVVTV